MHELWRGRLFNEAMTQRFFAHVLRIAEWQSLVSDEHFNVDYTMIEALASVKSFTRKDGSGVPPSDGWRNATFDFKGEKRCNETHQSMTYPDARLYKKGDSDKSRLCYLVHALMENRNGLVVDSTTTLASGTAERDAALIIAGRSINKAGATLGADKGYDAAAFVKELRRLGVTPHVAQKKTQRHRWTHHASCRLRGEHQEEQTGRGDLRLEQDHRRTAQGTFRRLGESARTDHVHFRRLQPDAHGDNPWLAFVGGGGITRSIEYGKC